MFELLKYSIEYQNLGWNVATVSAFGTIGFTCWQLSTLWHQYRNIQTGEAVSIGWHTYFGADFMAFIVYGLYAASIAMTFNALLGFGHLLVLWGLRVKTFTVWEKLLLPSIVVFPLLMYCSRTYTIDLGFMELTERQLLFLVYSIGTLIALGLQPLEMYRKKSRGDVSFPLLLSYTASTGFWVMFAFFGANDPVLKFLTVTAGILLCTSLGLWFRYQPQSATT